MFNMKKIEKLQKEIDSLWAKFDYLLEQHRNLKAKYYELQPNTSDNQGGAQNDAVIAVRPYPKRLYIKDTVNIIRNYLDEGLSFSDIAMKLTEDKREYNNCEVIWDYDMVFKLYKRFID